MRAWVVLSIAAFLMAPATAGGHDDMNPKKTAAAMAGAATTFLESLGPEQLKSATFAFDDKARFDWHYIPRSRSGLPLKAMTEPQRRLARRFLQSGLSSPGYAKAQAIMALEAVLREIEAWNWLGRDPDKYFFSFFGNPSETGTWGWRVEGHHLSLNITVVDGRLVADAPRFLGANPAHVSEGPLKGVRVLAAEEDLARRLVRSLEPEKRKQAVFSGQAFRDIVTGAEETVSPLEPVGIAAIELSSERQAALMELIDVYVSAMPPEIARQRMAAIEEGGIGSIFFGWAGGVEPGQPHYYRIQGPRFLIEYDNVQNDANHIHTVWRDFNGDFGRDLLREHLRESHWGG
ncbi:MAG: DUF3500 domain-containing protein [Desulfobacterales bacterium]